MKFSEIEGPPPPTLMDVPFRQLCVDGKFERALQLASVMRDWWFAQPYKNDWSDYDRTAEFHLWLGRAGAVSDIAFGMERRKSDRVFARAARRTR